jgi:hypothetical protein
VASDLLLSPSAASIAKRASTPASLANPIADWAASATRLDRSIADWAASDASLEGSPSNMSPVLTTVDTPDGTGEPQRLWLNRRTVSTSRAAGAQEMRACPHRR